MWYTIYYRGRVVMPATKVAEQAKDYLAIAQEVYNNEAYMIEGRKPVWA